MTKDKLMQEIPVVLLKDNTFEQEIHDLYINELKGLDDIESIKEYLHEVLNYDIQSDTVKFIIAKYDNYQRFKNNIVDFSRYVMENTYLVYGIQGREEYIEHYICEIVPAMMTSDDEAVHEATDTMTDEVYNFIQDVNHICAEAVARDIYEYIEYKE